MCTLCSLFRCLLPHFCAFFLMQESNEHKKNNKQFVRLYFLAFYEPRNEYWMGKIKTSIEMVNFNSNKRILNPLFFVI